MTSFLTICERVNCGTRNRPVKFWDFWETCPSSLMPFQGNSRKLVTSLWSASLYWQKQNVQTHEMYCNIKNWRQFPSPGVKVKPPVNVSYGIIRKQHDISNVPCLLQFYIWHSIELVVLDWNVYYKLKLRQSVSITRKREARFLSLSDISLIFWNLLEGSNWTRFTVFILWWFTWFAFTKDALYFVLI